MREVIWTFWTGMNPLTENRKRSLENLKRVTKAEVILITPENLPQYIKEGYPLHTAYEHLSLVHKSDYLRLYFMFHHGGGYSDIKESLGSWKRAFFTMDSNPDVWMVGTQEKKAIHIGYQENEDLYKTLKDNYKVLPENGAYIGRAGCPLFKECLEKVHTLLDKHYDALISVKNCPIRARAGDGSGYPIRWTEIGGSVVHELAFKYKKHIAFALPGFSTDNYQ
jgi:hypothetical protein